MSDEFVDILKFKQILKLLENSSEIIDLDQINLSEDQKS